MKQVAIVLSGCGVYDGTEIHEAVLTLLAVQTAGAKAVFFAPDTMQFHTVNHLTGSIARTNRSVPEESARIARGELRPLGEFKADEFDAIVFPGGFGAAKNLSTFAFDGTKCSVNAEVEKAIKAMLAAHKPCGFLCISPVIAAKVIGNGVKLTVGSDSNTAGEIDKMGAIHQVCAPHSFVWDEKFNVYSTPAYMSAKNLVEMRAGIESMIGAMLGDAK